MMKKRPFTPVRVKLTPYILGLILTLFVVSGCAHRAQPVAPVKSETPVTASQATPSTAPVTESADSGEETESVEEIGGEFDDAFADDFEESFEEDRITVADPLEPVNRAIFAFNDKLYFWVLKPVTKVLKVVVPQEIRTSTGNALHNIKAPVRIANSLLQGKFKQAGTEFSRFFINSTAGVMGIGDPAALYPALDHDREDFGQTLAVWGFKDGVYLVLPFLGPSTLRDTVGQLGDSLLNPLSYELSDTYEKVGVTLYEQVNNLSFRLGQYEAVKEGSLDPYVFMKNAYLQIRQEKIESGENSTQTENDPYYPAKPKIFWDYILDLF